MKYRCLLSYVMLLTTFSFSVGSAHAHTCSKENKGHIGSIQYYNASYSPTFTLSGDPENWMQLSPNYGINTDYGRALFTLLLTAKSSGIQVEIECSNGIVNKLILSDVDS
ncbi:hypothetical protein Xmau_02281 [Xenorhabdus mauleonii]|uniref:Uncharacterized protein n=1 Tax=Xenorhabdus mauleonii TaxID=351675 RepID=A0A1I3Q4C7_9GAMM|nr:hypothetical protein [Xenorhabdus mauleonii]PHM40095.1 hypothetical protein Xmau_02281 [Xenorhabdus mauleonii]SFJ28510.1 hypothetical protein SAMN05421680_10727 [Xenorhabdus mauleonii]